MTVSNPHYPQLVVGKPLPSRGSEAGSRGPRNSSVRSSWPDIRKFWADQEGCEDCCHYCEGPETD